MQYRWIFVTFFSWIIICVVFYKLNLGALLIGQQPLPDFDTYYQIAHDVASGQSPYALPYMQTAGPPLVIAPFFLLSWLPLNYARAIFTFVNLFSGIYACFLLVRYLKIARFFVGGVTLFALLLLTFPVRFSLFMGQPGLLLMLLVTIYLTTNNPIYLTYAVGLLTIIKTHFILLLISLWPKNRMAFLLSLVSIISALIIFFPVLKPRYYREFVMKKAINYAVSAQGIPNATDYYNQSLRSTLIRLGVGEWYLFFYPAISIPIIWWLIKTGDKRAGVLSAFILSPIIWQHYFVALYPVVLLTIWPAQRRPKIFALGTLALILMTIDLAFLHRQNLNLLSGILASHYFGGVLILWLLVTIHRKTKLTLKIP